VAENIFQGNILPCVAVLRPHLDEVSFERAENIMIIHALFALPLAVVLVVVAPAAGLENGPWPGKLALLVPVATTAPAVPICRLGSPWPVTGWAWVCEV
jgi:hypothetical protein